MKKYKFKKGQKLFLTYGKLTKKRCRVEVVFAWDPEDGGETIYSVQMFIMGQLWETMALESELTK